MMKGPIRHQMPAYMVKARQDILIGITQSKNDSEIAKLTGYGRNLVSKIRKQFNNNEDIFSLGHKLGAPSKMSPMLIQEVASLTNNNRRMSLNTVASIINNNPALPNVSHQFISNIRHAQGYKYLPPKQTFFMTDAQRQARINFATYHLNHNTDWTKVLFTDESMFSLDGNNTWLWRKRGEMDQSMFHTKKKFNQKVMLFGGISYLYSMPLISIEGTFDSGSYCDECIEGICLVLDMNSTYGIRNWMLMQDGARIHTCGQTMDYLNLYCNVLPNWPANSPDLNPIENL